MFCLGKCKISECPGDTAVAVIEGMQGHEPQMSDSNSQQGIEQPVGTAVVEPACPVAR